MNNPLKSPSTYTSEPIRVFENWEKFAHEYNSALLDLSEVDAVESIQCVKKLLVERLNEKIFSLQQESEQRAKQAEFISSLVTRV